MTWPSHEEMVRLILESKYFGVEHEADAILARFEPWRQAPEKLEDQRAFSEGLMLACDALRAPARPGPPPRAGRAGVAR